MNLTVFILFLAIVVILAIFIWGNLEAQHRDNQSRLREREENARAWEEEMKVNHPVLYNNVFGRKKKDLH